MAIELKRMTSRVFQRYLNFAVEHYANEHFKAGNLNWDKAMNRAEKEFEALLPERENTKDHYLFSIFDKNAEIGMIWLAHKTKEEGFIFDINIWDDYQDKGYGTQAMHDVERKAKELGIKYIGLHVFGHNKRAWHLYQKIGYVETNIRMKKTL